VHLTVDSFSYNQQPYVTAKLDDSIDAADFQKMATVARTKFPALERLTIKYQNGGRGGGRENAGARYDYQRSQTMVTTLSILLLHPHLKEIMVQDVNWEGMSEAIEDALKNQVVDEGDEPWELKAQTSNPRTYAILARPAGTTGAKA